MQFFCRLNVSEEAFSVWSRINRSGGSVLIVLNGRPSRAACQERVSHTATLTQHTHTVTLWHSSDTKQLLAADAPSGIELIMPKRSRPVLIDTQPRTLVSVRLITSATWVSRLIYSPTSRPTEVFLYIFNCSLKLWRIGPWERELFLWSPWHFLVPVPLYPREGTASLIDCSSSLLWRLTCIPIRFMSPTVYATSKSFLKEASIIVTDASDCYIFFWMLFVHVFMSKHFKALVIL